MSLEIFHMPNFILDGFRIEFIDDTIKTVDFIGKDDVHWEFSSIIRQTKNFWVQLTRVEEIKISRLLHKLTWTFLSRSMNKFSRDCLIEWITPCALEIKCVNEKQNWFRYGIFRHELFDVTIRWFLNPVIYMFCSKGFISKIKINNICIVILLRYGTKSLINVYNIIDINSCKKLDKVVIIYGLWLKGDENVDDLLLRCFLHVHTTLTLKEFNTFLKYSFAS